MPAVWDDADRRLGRVRPRRRPLDLGLPGPAATSSSPGPNRVPRVLNSPEVLRWNTDKRVSRDARRRDGPDDVPRAGRDASSPPESPFVVKPSVGAGSIGAARYDAGDERAQRHVADLHAAGKTVMVQPYLEAVDHDGELALHYLGRRRSRTRFARQRCFRAVASPGDGPLRRGADQRRGALRRRARARGAGARRASVRARGAPLRARRPAPRPGPSSRSSSPSRRSTSATPKAPRSASPTRSLPRASGAGSAPRTGRSRASRAGSAGGPARSSPCTLVSVLSRDPPGIGSARKSIAIFSPERSRAAAHSVGLRPSCAETRSPRKNSSSVWPRAGIPRALSSAATVRSGAAGDASATSSARSGGSGTAASCRSTTSNSGASRRAAAPGDPNSTPPAVSRGCRRAAPAGPTEPVLGLSSGRRSGNDEGAPGGTPSRRLVRPA